MFVEFMLENSAVRWQTKLRNQEYFIIAHPKCFRILLISCAKCLISCNHIFVGTKGKTSFVCSMDIMYFYLYIGFLLYHTTSTCRVNAPVLGQHQYSAMFWI